MRKLIVLVVLLLYAFQYVSWSSCRDFNNNFHFSTYDVGIEIDNLIHNDQNLPFQLIRFYHNKITLSTASILKSYLLYWDIKLWINLISPIGFIGLLVMISDISYLFKSKILLGFMVVSLIYPIVEILYPLPIKLPFRMFFLAFPWQIVSLLGIKKILLEKKLSRTYIFVALLIWVSVLWQIISLQDARNFCV